MNCQEISERIESMASNALSENDRQACILHISECDECQSALRGSEALRLVKNQRDIAAPDGLFEEIMARTVNSGQQTEHRNRFWLGAGFGAAAAAAIVVAVLTLGIFAEPPSMAPASAEFLISMTESRDVNVAIDAVNDMPGAQISITLSGGVELAGYGDRRELTWTDNLVAGVNKLTLPVVAIDNSGGQMIVRLDHGNSQQVFLINLKMDG